MNLGIFLSPGDSLSKQIKTGQFDRLAKYYLEPYSHHFRQIFIFSYADNQAKFSLPVQVKVISKPTWISNYCYQLLLPFIHYKIIRSINIFRVFQTPGGLPALISKLFFNKPYVVTYGYDYVQFAKKSQQWFIAGILTLIITIILKFSRIIIVTTPENLKFSRSVLIPNGVNPLEFKPTKNRSKNLILSVGRLESQKNYSLLIKIVSRSKFCRNLKLVIIGQGSEQKQLMSLAKKLQINLKIYPNLPYHQLIPWYQKAAVFILTSKYEGHPKTLIEALSCACPVLTTNFTGNPITHNFNGLISRPSDLSKYLDKLLIDKKLCRQLGMSARNLVIKKYNLNQLIKQEIKLLS